MTLNTLKHWYLETSVFQDDKRVTLLRVYRYTISQMLLNENQLIGVMFYRIFY